MRRLILAFILSFHSSAWGVAGGTPVDDLAVKKGLGLNFGHYQSSLDTPEIPIGPRVAITCGHCVSKGSINGGGNEDTRQAYRHPKMQKNSHDTNQAYDDLPSGDYGLPFFERANYAYDLALIVLGPDDKYPGPYMAVSRHEVGLHEKLILLGRGKNTSVPGHLCDGNSKTNQFAFGEFEVLDFYAQKVGFILTGRPAATCWGDSGGYYFRELADQSLELAGINSWGTEDGFIENPRAGVVRNFQGYLSGANDLTSPEIREWLLGVAADRKVEICGLNRECPPVPSPLRKKPRGDSQRK